MGRRGLNEALHPALLLAGILLVGAWRIPLIQKRPISTTRGPSGNFIVVDRMHGRIDRHVFTGAEEEAYRRYVGTIRFEAHAPPVALRIEDANEKELAAYLEWRHSVKGADPLTPFPNRTR